MIVNVCFPTVNALFHSNEQIRRCVMSCDVMKRVSAS